ERELRRIIPMDHGFLGRETAFFQDIHGRSAGSSAQDRAILHSFIFIRARRPGAISGVAV
ncbi:MAG TPA: hypothetical protein VHV47_00085, partial [Opitutaceae bacterium]|nr:hypothetical protein [Opitutaceae bacterium]